MTGIRLSDRALRWATSVDGQQILHLRRQRGLAREELATPAGISPDMLARLEREPAARCWRERSPGSPPRWASTPPR
jgi:DNA-binding transcriptional regulator YiaG